MAMHNQANTLELTNTPENISNLVSEVDGLQIDREFIAQERLDLANRCRTSLFPWRGQFSPELIEIFLSEYAIEKSVVLDPFVGSGTTVFEAARKSLTCYGVEINPSAVEMASTVHFANLEMAERKKVINTAQSLLDKYMSAHREPDLFSKLDEYQKDDKKPLEESFREMLQEASISPFVYNVIANTIIRYKGSHENKEINFFFRSFFQHKSIIEQLPYSPNTCKIFHCDSRNIPLDNESVDFIITSPPYINVFNYHQYNRPAMELIGWDLLHIAKSEFGSNRKNRRNRFLTVVQYAIDILQALWEMRRLIRKTGRIVIVVGRESNVRGISFLNGQIVAALAVGGAGFHLDLRQERMFKNKFGDKIYEDILHLVPAEKPLMMSEDFARSLAQYVLNEAANKTTGDVHNDILAAISNSSMVLPSPNFRNLNKQREAI